MVRADGSKPKTLCFLGSDEQTAKPYIESFINHQERGFRAIVAIASTSIYMPGRLSDDAVFDTFMSAHS